VRQRGLKDPNIKRDEKKCKYIFQEHKVEPKTERTGITESTGTVPRREHGPYSPISQPITLHKETRVYQYI
jgi:hypothetical protein